MPGRRRKNNSKELSSSSSPSSTKQEEEEVDENDSPNLPEWFNHCKITRKVINYDTNRYPFRELYADWLGVPSDALDRIQTLSELRDATEPVHPKVAQAWRNACMSPKLKPEARASNTFTQRKLYQSDQYQRLIDTYRLFVREVLAPMCGGPNDDDEDNHNANVGNDHHHHHLVYQCPPTTRVVFPNGRRTISMHSDRDYKDHQPSEINFWIPLTKVWGNNSLWLESLPGKNDFCPVELEYGQCLLFDGYDCRHYTVHNDTESCRVSFDFRVIPSSLCRQRRTLGDFCMEETTDAGLTAHPHPFWSITRGLDYMPTEEDKPIHTTLSCLYESLSLEVPETSSIS